MARRKLRRGGHRSKRGFPFRSLLFVVVVAAGSVFFLHKNSQSHGTPSVLGVATQSYTSATVTWNTVPGAAGYNIYYKTTAEKDYTYAVRGLSASATSYKIDYLLKNKKYEYEVKAFDQYSRREIWTSTRKPITNYTK